MKKIVLLIILFSVSLFPQNERLSVEDIWAMKRIGSFDVSPDAKTIVFTVTEYNMEENTGDTDIYLINSDGDNLRPLKNSDKNESNPLFSPDGKRIAYSFNGQIWTCNIDGSNEKQISNIYTGVSGFEWSPDGSKILFTSMVYPACEDQNCNREKDEAKEKSKVKAEIFTELMYRHWNDWRGEKRSHLFLLDVATGEFVDLTLFSEYDVPPIALGSSNDYNISPDGNEVAFTMNTAEFLATSTNNDIFAIDLKDAEKGKTTPKFLISESKGNDNEPVYSPDGKYIAFSSMRREGFEADNQNLILYNRTTDEYKNLTEDFDYSVSEIIWSPNSKTIYFTSPFEIYNSIYKIDIESEKIEMILKEHVNSGIKISKDGETFFFKQQRSNLPYEIFAMNIDGSNVRQITYLNKEHLAEIEMNEVETFWTEGAEGTKVQSILVKPPDFNSEYKYPMIFLIHGGPQGHWTDDFHYRWNLQMFAAPGYIVVAPNPRGSVGYGQKFTDEISQDWGGKVYTDLMNVYDYALENFSFIDENNTFAAGASYGGYMINWIETQTDRFNALVNHDGVFNLVSMYGTTEELWFPEWEFGGPPWKSREIYEKWSPHMYIDNAKTPMLIVHGAYDFRVPEEQAFQLFTSLQRLEVESKFLYFPDETHFVLKPQNAKLWWNTIFDWFQEHHKLETP